MKTFAVVVVALMCAAMAMAQDAPAAAPAEEAVLVNGYNTEADMAMWEGGKGDVVNKLEISKDWKSEGEASLKITFPVGKTYCITSAEAFPAPGNAGDWSGFKALKFDMYNSGDKPFAIWMQIKSGKPRFKMKTEPVAKSKELVTVTVLTEDIKKAGVDLTAIGQINFGARGNEAERVLHIDNARLVK